MPNPGEISLGDKVFTIATRDLHDLEGNRVDLRHKSSEVLACLAAQAGEIVSKSDLMEFAWPDTTVTDESLTQCIADIRRAIGDHDQSILKTFVGKGYCLEAVPAGRSLAAKANFRLAAALAVLAAAAFTAFWFLRPEPAPAGPPRIAVLAFDDLSAGEDNGYLGDGIAEGVITELARLKGLAVVARNSSFRFRDSKDGITEIADKLNADWVVEGSKQKSGNRLRVTAQLINGHDGTHIWAHDYDADIGELFDVQSEIISNIARNIGRHTTFRPLPQSGRAAVSAMHYYIQGNAEYRLRTRETTLKARDLYQKAIEADPNASFGYVGMTRVYVDDLGWDWVNPGMPETEKLRRAEETAEKAVALDPENHIAHVVRALIHVQAGELEEAVLRFQTAVALNPSAASVMVESTEPLVYLGRGEEAIPILRKAIARDPITPGYYYWYLGWAQWSVGQCGEGITAMKQMPKIFPAAHRNLAALYACNGELDKAKSAMDIFMEAHPNLNLRMELESEGKSYRDPEIAERWINDLRAAGMPE